MGHSEACSLRKIGARIYGVLGGDYEEEGVWFTLLF